MLGLISKNYLFLAKLVFLQKLAYGLGQDIYCIKVLVVHDFEACSNDAKQAGILNCFRWPLNGGGGVKLEVFNNAGYRKIVVCTFKSFEQWP